MPFHENYVGIPQQPDGLINLMPARNKTSSRPLNIETLEDRLPLAAD